MLARVSILAMLLSATAIGGCSEEPAVEMPSNVLKISVFRDGSIEMDGARIEPSDVNTKLQAASAAGKSVWYYREEPQRAPPEQQEAAMMTVLEAVASNKLPIRLSAKPDFSDAVNDKGISLTP